MGPPAQFNHCKTIYNSMLEGAVEEKFEGQDVLAWEGFTTKLFEEHGLATPYYTSVMQKLQAMGCVIQLHRGGGGGMSKWACMHPPTRDLFDNSRDRALGRASKDDVYNQKFKDTTQMLQDVESRVVLLEGSVRDLNLVMTELLTDMEKINARLDARGM